MSGRGPTRLVPAVVALVLMATLAACGGESADDAPSTGTSSSSNETEADAGSDTGSDGDSVALTITREGDVFTPNGERVELEVDQTLVLTLTSDEAGEMHVHSTPEQEIAYDAGTSEHEITIDRPGVVEVESHDPDVVVLQLEVR